MFKRMAIRLLLPAILLLTSGCSQGTSSFDFTEKDFYLNIDGKEYRCDDNIQTVIANLGSGYSYSDALSCAYDGLDKIYSYELAEFYTNPLPEGDLVSEIYTENPEVTTSKGISVGATKEEILAVHGEDCEDMGNLIIYRVPGSNGKEGRGSLCFEMEGSEVIAIFVTTEPI